MPPDSFNFLDNFDYSLEFGPLFSTSGGSNEPPDRPPDRQTRLSVSWSRVAEEIFNAYDFEEKFGKLFVKRKTKVLLLKNE